MSPEDLALAISRFVNGASDEKLQQVADILNRDNRTLQQKTMKLSCLFIEGMANKKHHEVDPRNSQSHKVAKQMIAGHKAAAKKEIIDQDGDISASLSKFIDEESLPSKNLPTI